MRRYALQISILALALVAGPLIASAWTPAPANPPANNVDAPINAGGTAQSKVAGLLLNTGNNANGLIVQGAGNIIGKVGIGALAPTSKLQVGEDGDGSAIKASAFFYSSDARLKENIVTITNALSRVLQLRGVSYDLKSTGERHVGVIGQEVEKVFPEAVNTDVNGIKAVEYGNLIGPLIEAIKAQQLQIDALKAEVAALKAR